MRSGKIGLQADGLAQGCGGLRQFALLLEHRAERVVRLGIISFGLDSGVQLVGGLVELTLLPECYSQRVMNIRLAGIEFSGLLQFDDRLGQFVFQFQGQAEIVVQGRIVRRYL